jgi:DNA-3-methyladenine glycosylase II
LPRGCVEGEAGGIGMAKMQIAGWTRCEAGDDGWHGEMILKTPGELTSMKAIIHDEAALTQGLDVLCDLDPVFAAARGRMGEPALRRWDPGFPTLFDIVLGQQVSTASARAIRAKVVAALDPFTPEALVAATPEELRACGLSRQKIAYSKDLAERVVDGRCRLEILPELGDEEAIAELVQIKGIGRWTAEIYLLFALGRADSWPAADLALASAFHHMHDLPERPNEKHLRHLAEKWRPWRGAAAHFLWHYYHHLSQRDAIIK